MKHNKMRPLTVLMTMNSYLSVSQMAIQSVLFAVQTVLQITYFVLSNTDSHTCPPPCVPCGPVPRVWLGGFVPFGLRGLEFSQRLPLCVS